MLGKTRFDVGGETPGFDKSAPKQKRDDDDVEPVAYHAGCPELYECFGEAVSVKAWIDLTAMDPTLAVTAVKNRVPYFGVTLTPEHQKWFDDKVCDLLFQSMKDPTSPFYKPGLAAILSAISSSSSAPGHPAPKPKANPKPKGKAKGKAKGTAKAKAESAAEKLKKQLAELRGAANEEEEEEEEDGDEGEDEENAEEQD
eukprot:9490012-Pyramimonas_sp.AAC.1